MQLDLERFFDASSIARGTSYARQGRVTGLQGLSPTGELTAFVRGSSLYRVALTLSFDVGQRLTSLKGRCNCPLGKACKHMVALLLTWQNRQAKTATLPAVPPPAAAPSTAPLFPESLTADRAAPDPRATLPWHVTQWLSTLTATDPTPQTPDYPERVRDRLVYVLALSIASQSSSGLSVTAMKATVMGNGRPSERATRYDVERLKRRDVKPQFILRRDLEILHALETIGLPANGGSASSRVWQPRFVADGPPDLLPILRRIAETGRGRWGDRDGPFLYEDPPKAVTFRWQGHPGGAQDLRPFCAGTDTPLIALPIATPTWLDPVTGAFGLIETDLSPAQMLALSKAPKIPAEIATEVAARLSAMGGRVPVPQAIGVETRQGRDPVPVLRLFGLRGHRSTRDGWRRDKEPVVQPALRLCFDYAGHIAPVKNAAALRFKEGDTIVTLQRDSTAEAAAILQLSDQGALPTEYLETYSFGRQAEKGDLVFVDAEWDPMRETFSQSLGPALQFLATHVPALRAAGWRIEIDPSWPCPLVEEPVQVTAHLGQSKTGGLFDFGLTLKAGSQEADLGPLIADILEALPPHLTEEEIAGPGFEALIAASPYFLELPDGHYAPVEIGQLTDLLRVLLRSLGLMSKVHPAEAGQVATVSDALEGCGIPFVGADALRDLGRRLNLLTSPAAIEPPPSVKATLRPYQRIGYGWLSALSDTGFGGILADDMGLGKTLQTLALLAKRHLEDKANHPSLLIVPTSLARAWARQAAEFVPDLKVLVLQGNERKALFDQIETAHLVISTYPLLHRDHETLLVRDWDLAILDEAQAVKNPASTAAKRIRDIRARMRLALTGTPMENSLTDLWSLFDWLIPGLLGDRKTFRAQVALPVEKEGNAQAQAQLNRRIQPFLMRRTKDQVALDLPAKTEITELIPLGSRQQALYETVRLAMDARVREAIAARGLKGSQITILDALLKMRQACCDPSLLKDAAHVAESAKRDRLMEILEALVQEGRKVLVFSQFVEMLRLIEADVLSRGWTYEWLTGETMDRDSAVTRFQDGKAPIFLISLKAGGVGLTLTAADTVILYDPWWNPAVERQAMDRAHRIGQTKAVFVYRLVAEGTVEEAILALQARKQALADALFEGQTSAGFAFDQEAIAELFRPIGKDLSDR